MSLARLPVLLGALLATGCLFPEDATITDPDSPYYDRPCELEQHREYKSDLVADCRCFTNQAPSSGIQICRRPANLANEGQTVGEGPTFGQAFNIEFNGGFLDESEGEDGTVYVALGFGASTDRRGALIKVDLATGDRELISGLDPTGVDDVVNSQLPETGSGPPFRTGHDVARGPDGMLYVYMRPRDPATHEIQRIDPETGDREIVWKGRDARFAQCGPPGGEPEETLQYTDTGFYMDELGRVYLPFSNPMQGRGIVRLSEGFEDCEIITGVGAEDYVNVGQGPAISGFIQGFTMHDGRLHAFSTLPKQFFAVDIETGDREVLFQPGGVTPPERWARWDEDRGVWWIAGFNNSVSIDAVDLTTGTSASIFDGGVFDWMPLGAAGPVQINSLNYGPVWLRDNGNLLVAQDGMSIVEYEPSTGNSVILSL